MRGTAAAEADGEEEGGAGGERIDEGGVVGGRQRVLGRCSHGAGPPPGLRCLRVLSPALVLQPPTPSSSINTPLPLLRPLPLRLSRLLCPPLFGEYHYLFVFTLKSAPYPDPHLVASRSPHLPALPSNRPRHTHVKILAILLRPKSVLFSSSSIPRRLRRCCARRFQDPVAFQPASPSPSPFPPLKPFSLPFPSFTCSIPPLTNPFYSPVLSSHSDATLLSMADSSSHRLDLRVGGKYRLGKKIGSGSFGASLAFRILSAPHLGL